MSQLSSQALRLRQMLTPDEIENTLFHIKRLYVAQLKTLCKSLLLSLKGKRQDHIDRLEQHIRHCEVTGQNVRLLALRTIVLKMMTNDPLPKFENLYGALQSGLIDHNLMADQLARLQQLANQVKRKPRTNTLVTSSANTGAGGHAAGHVVANVQHSSQGMPYSPHHSGPMLLFQSTIFYTLRRMLKRFPYVIPASKGRNLSNMTVNLDATEASLLLSDPHMKLYLFSGLLSSLNPSNADIQFPPIEIHVDGINTKQYVKGLKGKAGTCRPADLTPFVNISRPFTINIVYSDAAEPYLLYVYVVEARTPEEIVKFISIDKEHISASFTKKSIIEDYEQNQDDDIVMATSSLTLRCPLTYARIAVPMRSIECDHIQCFDGLSFLTMQERIPSWICPVCSRKIDPHRLSVSDYIKEILDMTSDEIDTVNLNPDGSWEAVNEDAVKEDHSSSKEGLVSKETSAAQAEESIEIISLDSESEDEQPDVTIRSATNENSRVQHIGFGTSDTVATDERLNNSFSVRNGGEVDDEMDEDFRNNRPNVTQIAPNQEVDDYTIMEIEDFATASSNSAPALSHSTLLLPANNAHSRDMLPSITHLRNSLSSSDSTRRGSVSSEDRPIQSLLRRPRTIDDEQDDIDNVPQVGTTSNRSSDTVSRDIVGKSSIKPTSNVSNQAEKLSPKDTLLQLVARSSSELRAQGGFHLMNESRPSTTIPLPNSGSDSCFAASGIEIPGLQTRSDTVAVEDNHSLNNHYQLGPHVGIGAQQINIRETPEGPKSDLNTVPSSMSHANISNTPAITIVGRREFENDSPRTLQVESSDTPKAKRLKIPVDANYSLIDSICQTISRPGSTVNSPSTTLTPDPLSTAEIPSAQPIVSANPMESPPLKESHCNATNSHVASQSSAAIEILKQVEHSPGPIVHTLPCVSSVLSQSRVPHVRNFTARPPDVSRSRSDDIVFGHSWSSAYLDNTLGPNTISDGQGRPVLRGNASEPNGIYSLVLTLGNKMIATGQLPYSSAADAIHIASDFMFENVPSVAQGNSFEVTNSSNSLAISQTGQNSSASVRMLTPLDYSGVRPHNFRKLVLDSSALINQYKEMQATSYNHVSSGQSSSADPSPQAGNNSTPTWSSTQNGSNRPIEKAAPSIELSQARLSDARSQPPSNGGSNSQQYRPSIFIPRKRHPQAPDITVRAPLGGILPVNPNPPANAKVRYSKSPFDVLKESAAAKKVKGLLGIEVSLNILSAESHDERKTSSTPPSTTVQKANNSNVPATALSAIPVPTETLGSGDHISELLTSNASKIVSPLDNRIQDMTLTTPGNARVISYDPVPERTWNKRLSKVGQKAKFDPKEINLSNIIDLDDD